MLSESAIYLRTKKSCYYPIEWIGVADFDGFLRFELKEGAEYVKEIFDVFTNPEQTQEIMRTCMGFESFERLFEGYTKFKGLSLKDNGNIVVTLSK